MKTGFGSDNHSGVHPEIFKAMAEVNVGHEPSYGTDEISRRALKIFEKHFGAGSETHFVFNGTAANVLALGSLVQSHHAIFASVFSHLSNDECGAPEKWLGCKIINLPSKDGKIKVSDMQAHLIRKGDQHCSQPHAISVTQPTEYGTLYSIDELKEIAAFAKQNNLLLHMDGTRLYNAAVALGVDLYTLTGAIGIDVLSLGGTKNGLMFGEAIVFFNKELARDFKYRRKQALQLPSKTRFIAAQFERFLGSDLWREIARHSLEMAQLLRGELEGVSGIEITQKTQSNAVFAKIPKAFVSPLREQGFFYVWDELTFEIRLMTTYDTQKEDVLAFANKAKELAKMPTAAKSGDLK
jgi:threonine aldolase